jgi:Protein of unknown function (DUF938)
MDNPPDLRRYAPATDRNRQPILDILRQVLPPTGTVLEISSGTGEHATFFAPQLAPLFWLPSDPNPDARASITAWQQSEPCVGAASPMENRVYPPIDLDASNPNWSIAANYLPITAIVNINMIHIAPRSAYLGLIAGVSRLLSPGGIFYLYGPFKREGVHTAPSNAAFDESLRDRNPEWGIRDLEETIDLAEGANLALEKIYPMPANNLSVVFKRREGRE